MGRKFGKKVFSLGDYLHLEVRKLIKLVRKERKVNLKLRKKQDLLIRNISVMINILMRL